MPCSDGYFTPASISPQARATAGSGVVLPEGSLLPRTDLFSTPPGDRWSTLQGRELPPFIPDAIQASWCLPASKASPKPLGTLSEAQRQYSTESDEEQQGHDQDGLHIIAHAHTVVLPHHAS